MQRCQPHAEHGMEWKTIFPYSKLEIFFHFILKIFHSILKFSSVFHFILAYQDTFGPEATRNLYFTFTPLRVPLKVGLVAREGKHHGTILLISNLDH